MKHFRLLQWNSHFMSGNGGNHVVMIPELELVVVVTKTDYNRPGAHEAARRLVDERVLPVVAHWPGEPP